LDNDRSIYVYLPPSYESAPQARYPVLYMHDGQHVFASDRFGDSWEVHHTVERLVGEGRMREIIVVGVASIPNSRIAEYVHDHPAVRKAFHTEPAGEKYEAFLIDEVKTYIDRTYRTLPGKEHTAIMGSSAGGLVSYHVGMRRPDVFGNVGILSPFFVHSYMNGSRLSRTPIYRRFDHHPSIRVWLDMGGAEGLLTVPHARRVADELIGSGFVFGDDLIFYLDPEAGHTQKDWANRIQAPLLYFFGSIGQPKRLELFCTNKIGIRGPVVRLYPNVEYDSGFRKSLLRAHYQVADEAIAEMEPDGTILPKQAGTTEIRVAHEGLQATLAVEIVPALPETVAVEVTVEVPPETKSDDRIYAGFEIPKTADHVYRGSFRLPRDLTFDVKVSKGFGANEKRQSTRRFKTSEDLALHFQVEEWENPMIQSEAN
jgi:predicted alpha/beta superfamily hydrolase